MYSKTMLSNQRDFCVLFNESTFIVSKNGENIINTRHLDLILQYISYNSLKTFYKNYIINIFITKKQLDQILN